MTTFYLDYEGGNDANDGLTFATRFKSITSGPTAARIAPGDTIRVMASPDATSLGQSAQWTDGPLPARTAHTTAPTNAAPIVIGKTGHGLVTGDTYLVDGATGNTNANGVWSVTVSDANTFSLNGSSGNAAPTNNAVGRKVTNCAVTLTSAVTQNIALCGNRGTKTNWTASANVTCDVLTTDYKEGGECQRFTIATGFTTGKVAYLPIGPLDLSGYQQVSFWVKYTSGNSTLSLHTLELCTDATGDTSVHSVPIPATNALNQWVPITVDLGVNMNAAIASIAMHQHTDGAAVTLIVDHIIACKASSAADSLSLTSLISKDPGDGSYGDGYEAWFAIQSINGTRVMLEGQVNTIPGSTPQRGYSGTTESVTLYKRETTKTAMASANTAQVQTWQEGGTSGNPITLSGGWDRTSMATQSGETWFDGQNGYGLAIAAISSASTYSFVHLDKLNFARYFREDINPDDCSIGSIKFASMGAAPLSVFGARLAATTLSAVCCGGSITPGPGAVVQTIARASGTTSGNGVTLGVGSRVEVEITQANNNASNGVAGGTSSYIAALVAAHGNAASGYAPLSKSVAGSVVANNNTVNGISGGALVDWIVLAGSTSGNASGGVSVTTGRGTLRNFTIGEATEVTNFTAYNDARIYSEKHDGTAGNNVVFCDGGLIQTQAAVVHGSATLAWKFSPTSANRNANYPLNLSIAKVACAASALVTITGWFQRSDTGLSAQLVCKGGQIAGVASDVVSVMTASANTWEQLSITFTPSESGVVEIEAQFWGGTTYNGYASDLSISQA